MTVSKVMTVSKGKVMTVSKGKLLETLPKWGSIYTVEADISIKEIPMRGMTNIFHFTQSANFGDIGSQIPMVSIIYGYFYICGDINICLTVNYDLGKKYHVKIQQFKSWRKKTIYKVQINDNIEYSGENTDAKDYENVKVYVSDPWHHDAFTSDYGVLENFKYYVADEANLTTRLVISMNTDMDILEPWQGVWKNMSVQCFSNYCPHVKLKGVSNASGIDFNGKYDLTINSVEWALGRPVYKHSNMDSYIFWEDNQWNIGVLQKLNNSFLTDLRIKGKNIIFLLEVPLLLQNYKVLHYDLA